MCGQGLGHQDPGRGSCRVFLLWVFSGPSGSPCVGKSREGGCGHQADSAVPCLPGAYPGRDPGGMTAPPGTSVLPPPAPRPPRSSAQDVAHSPPLGPRLCLARGGHCHFQSLSGEPAGCPVDSPWSHHAALEPSWKGTVASGVTVLADLLCLKARVAVGTGVWREGHLPGEPRAMASLERQSASSQGPTDTDTCPWGHRSLASTGPPPRGQQGPLACRG